ncbi:MAG: hypothetical protein IPM82_30380 [Saprospiraceae bacterium]|nr:hypothetical protein [Saprospiraceae bacterium]
MAGAETSASSAAAGPFAEGEFSWWLLAACPSRMGFGWFAAAGKLAMQRACEMTEVRRPPWLASPVRWKKFVPASMTWWCRPTNVPGRLVISGSVVGIAELLCSRGRCEAIVLQVRHSTSVDATRQKEELQKLPWRLAEPRPCYIYLKQTHRRFQDPDKPPKSWPDQLTAPLDAASGVNMIGDATELK